MILQRSVIFLAEITRKALRNYLFHDAVSVSAPLTGSLLSCNNFACNCAIVAFFSRVTLQGEFLLDWVEVP